TIVKNIPEQSNLILDGYLDMDYPVPQSISLCLGAGVVTTPAATDTDLGNQVSAKGFGWGSNSAGLVSIHSKESNGYILKVSNTIDFSYQDISDNEITEIGLRNGGATGTLVTRALIKDQSGNPASIQIAEGQTLRLTYSLYVFLPFIITEGVAS